MPLIEHTLDGKVDKVKIALDRIKNYAPIENGFMNKPYYTAYSGGKDSDVIRILCELSGIKYELHHNHTTIDAPETVYYVRSVVPEENIHYPEISMWKLIVKKKFPPTRIIRYCCSELKEKGGKDRFVMTGVRWTESIQRSTRGIAEIQGSTKKTALILNNDNAENRRMFETCTKKGKKIINPIIDWDYGDVWEFLDYYNYKSNPLYGNGYNRIGCIGCPMVKRKRWRDFNNYPKYKGYYINAFQRMVDEHGYAKSSKSFTSGEAVFDWWMMDKPLPREIEGQLII